MASAADVGGASSIASSLRAAAGRHRPDRGRATPVGTWLTRVRPVAVVLALGVLLGAIWALLQVTGGSRTPLPHLFYVPIIAATLTLGVRGAVGTALASALLAGPLTPLDSFTGEEQPVAYWLVRGAFFLLVAGVASLAFAAHERLYTSRLTADLDDVARPATATLEPVDTALVPLVGGVIADGAFHPVFQPIYRLADGCLLAVEALTRFDAEPSRRPDQWFTAAAASGQGVALELATLRTIFDAARALPPDVALSVNASPATLGDPAFLDLVRHRGTRPLTVEVTEHAVVEDYPVLSRQVDALRAEGALLAVDDAGAGIASMRHIVQLAPDVIKLDISLSQDVGSTPLRRALAGSLVQFADRTGATLVVEGIESAADLRTWTALGAHAVQGYLVGRPGPLPLPPDCVAIATLRGRLPDQQRR